MIAVAKATRSPAVTSISCTLKDRGPPVEYWKNRSQVARYSAMPRLSSGSGTSNISMSSPWCARMRSISLSRTADAHASIRVRIAASSSMVGLLFGERRVTLPCFDASKTKRAPALPEPSREELLCDSGERHEERLAGLVEKDCFGRIGRKGEAFADPQGLVAFEHSQPGSAGR